MSDPPLGRWAPLGVPQVGDLFRRASFRWWISGGRALELHVGRSWRDHGDTDIGIRRTDVAALVAALPGWELHIAARGRLSRWRGEALDPALGQNNLWCRRPGGPWELDVALGEGDDEAWVDRRDPGVRIAWADAVLHTAEGVPYLAPELQLLFKSVHLREKDTVDARAVIPLLDRWRAHRLCRLLPGDHPWQAVLTAG